MSFFLASGLALAGCGSDGNRAEGQPQDSGIASATAPVTPELERRFDEVRAIHDEVMPERGRLVRLQARTMTADLPAATAAFAKTRLARADDMMMDWMYADVSLTQLADSLSEAEIADYLDRRETSIRRVADSMRAAIDYAELTIAQ